MRRVEIAPAVAAWRQAARGLLALGVPPAEVAWADGSSPEQGTLPVLPADPTAPLAPVQGGRVPRRFLDLAAAVACHRDPERWDLLYRVLWRLNHGEPHLLSIAVDDDIARLAPMEKAVHRDCHKMKAFVRFRRVADGEGERFIAWHRPDHAIVERVAPFFVDRFGGMRWSILTPDASALWDGRELSFGPGLPRTAAPADDELEDLWRTYYGSIFNPARILLKAMRAELPVRHWPTLPETQLIPDLLRAAPGRVAAMIAASAKPTARDYLPPGEPDLEALARAVQGCAACDLCQRATQAVFGEGPAGARLLLVGEQPGDQEDREGRPFVGPAGRLLDRALEEAGILREEVYLTNTVKHFKWEPRGKLRLHKNPSAGEIAVCRPWLEEEIARIRPERIVCLGATAARSLMGGTFRLSRQRGEVLEDTRWAPWLLATWHPAALLRLPEGERREELYRVWVEDLRRAAAQREDPAGSQRASRPE